MKNRKVSTERVCASIGATVARQGQCEQPVDGAGPLQHRLSSGPPCLLLCCLWPSDHTLPALLLVSLGWGAATPLLLLLLKASPVLLTFLSPGSMLLLSSSQDGPVECWLVC